MIENTNRKPSGINRQAMKTWGMLFLLLGIAGRGIVENGILGLQDVTGQHLFEAMEQNPSVMGIVTVALVLRVVEACAVPLFAFMLVEGVKHTRDFNQYLLRVLGLAVLSEIPFNLVMSSKVIDLSTRNPVFGLVLAMVVLWFFRRYPGKEIKNIAVKAAVMVAALVWATMLNIDHGSATVVLTAVLWAVWDQKTHFRTMAGCVASVVCTLFSLYYLAAPMTFMVVHFYNGEKGEGNQLVNYLVYPAMLLVVGLSTLFLF